MKNLNLKHFVLMGTAVLQVVLFVIFLVRLFNGTIVQSYLDKERYEKAVSVINKYDKLSENEEITNKINDILSTTKSDYLNGSLTFGQADSKFKQFSEIEIESCKKILNDSQGCITAINSGDNAMNNHKYDEALECYSSISDESAENMTVKDEKIRSVYNVMSEELVKLAGEQKYAEVIGNINKLKAEITDKELLSQISKWEMQYLGEWVDYQRSQHEFSGTYGALRLAAEYDKLTGNKDSVTAVDEELQQYIMTGIGNQKYDNVLELINSNYDIIKECLGTEGENTYNEFRITCVTALLNQAQTDGEYLGEKGAIKLADQLNSYREGAADKTALINALAARERYALIDKINATRTAAGLPELISDPGLENSAYAMMSKLDNGSYDDMELYHVLTANGVKYDKACCAWNGSAAAAEEVFSKFTPIEDYGILTEPELKKIGVGMSFDETDQTFSWFIIEIKQ